MKKTFFNGSPWDLLRASSLLLYLFIFIFFFFLLRHNCGTLFNYPPEDCQASGWGWFFYPVTPNNSDLTTFRSFRLHAFEFFMRVVYPRVFWPNSISRLHFNVLLYSPWHHVFSSDIISSWNIWSNFKAVQYIVYAFMLCLQFKIWSMVIPYCVFHHSIIFFLYCPISNNRTVKQNQTEKGCHTIFIFPKYNRWLSFHSWHCIHTTAAPLWKKKTLLY